MKHLPALVHIAPMEFLRIILPIAQGTSDFADPHLVKVDASFRGKNANCIKLNTISLV
jgi:hypothetical protein